MVRRTAYEERLRLIFLAAINRHGWTAVDANPHTWLKLNPDESHATENFVFGVLEREYHGRANSALEFTTLKLRPTPPAEGGPTITAERAEVLLPGDADDRFTDPFALAAEVDRMAVASKPVLLGYVTIYFPGATRLHRVWSQVRSFAELIAERELVATIAVLHAPFRAGSANPIHAHLMIVPRELNSLGLGRYQHMFCYPRGQRELASLWNDHRLRGT